MLRNYLKIAFRNLLSGGWYSALNIGGLAVVLSVSLLLFWWVNDELSFDTFHKDVDRIYLVNAHFGTGTDENTFEGAPAPLAIAAGKSVPGVEAVVSMCNYPFHTVRVNGKTFTEKSDISYADENFLKIFSGFQVLYGDSSKPFPSSNSVVLTAGLAKKYFGTENAIGKILTTVENKKTFTVGAVLANMPDNSSLHNKMYVPMHIRKQAYVPDGSWKNLDENWDDYEFSIYLKLSPGVDPATINRKLTSIKDAVRKKEEDGGDYRLQAFTKTHLYAPDGKNSGMQQVRILGVIAILLLSIGCINYVNLTTARATRRSKEVGIRKVVGAGSRQLAGQLLVESFMTLSLSLILAIILIQLLLPFYTNITDKAGHFSLYDVKAWAFLLGALALTFILAGIYPAMLVAGFNPIAALRGRSTQANDAGLRRGLVILQFVLATILISGTLVIGRQLRFIRERDSGLQREHIFSFNGRKFSQQFKQALAGESGVAGICTASGTPIQIEEATGGVDWDGKDANRMVIMAQMSIDQAFIPNFGIKLVAGRNFDGNDGDSNHFILNETAIKQAGIKDPIGKRFKRSGTEGKIIGVVKDFNITTIHEPIIPLILFSSPKNNNFVHVRTSGQSPSATIAAAEKLWKQYAPEYPFEYTFLDEDYNRDYKAEQQTGQLFNFFAGIAILVSCLGLLGLVAFTAEQRTKEIGIRKVLGATVANITTLLSKDFMKLVIIAIVIASPIAWFAMDLWLQNFAYKITIEWWMFAAAGLLAVITALLTIGFQSIKAALADPVKSLKTE